MNKTNAKDQNLILSNDKLCEVIGRNIDLLPVIFRFGIGSNMGQDTISTLCLKKNLDEEFLLAVINTYHSGSYFPSSSNINLSLLTDFLIKTHEYHKEVTIPLLRNLMRRLSERLPGTKLVITLEKYLNEYISKLLIHIEFEEQQIFPLVSHLSVPNDLLKGKNSMTKLKKIFHQHANVETEITDLIMIITQHIPEHTDVQLFHDMLHTLSHFEKEQIDHARFEDKILVPRLIELIQNQLISDASR